LQPLPDFFLKVSLEALVPTVPEALREPYQGCGTELDRTAESVNGSEWDARFMIQDVGCDLSEGGRHAG